jgi:hypothetical protein
MRAAEPHREPAKLVKPVVEEPASLDIQEDEEA